MSRGVREHKVVVLVKRDFKRLFSVVERKDGDLLISIHHAESYRPFGESGGEQDPKILHQHYSVHRSNSSQNEINVIKHTLKFDDGSEVTTPHYTKAIKQTKRFAVLFTRRASDLTAPRYVYTKERRDVLTTYNPKMSTLYYMLAVCAPDHNISVPKSPDLLHREFTFAHFKMVVFWSFGLLPAHSSGAIAHQLMSYPLVDALQDPSAMDGHDLDWVLTLFRGTRESLHAELIDLVQRDFAEIAREVESTRNLPFVQASPVQ